MKNVFLKKIEEFLNNVYIAILAYIGSLFIIFITAFLIGNILSSIIEKPFYFLHSLIMTLPDSIWRGLLLGLKEGVEGGCSIIIPYMIPLVFVLSVFESTNFFSKISYTLDPIFQKIGLKGYSLAPLIIGYGCTVPALMATRSITDRRAKIATILAVNFIPCSARSVVILGLVGKYLGPFYTFAFYVANFILVLFLSFIISKLKPVMSVYIKEDFCKFCFPHFPSVLKKVWYYLCDFLVSAWPTIIISSIALSVINHFNFDSHINNILSPITHFVLKLPTDTGITIFFGIFRKELTMIMLNNVFNGQDIKLFLSSIQILTLATFTTLYIPCLASLAAAYREGGLKAIIYSIILGLSVSLFLGALIARL